MSDTSTKLTADASRQKLRRTVKKPDIARFQLAQLRRLLSHRGHRWQDDERSRRDLQVLLDLGLIGPDAQCLAPWLSGGELEEMINAASVSPGWNARTLGDRFGVTLDEKLDLGLRNLECFDVPRWQYKKALAKRQRVNDAERGRRRRVKVKLEKQMTTEADTIIMRMVPPGTPRNAVDMVEASHQRQRSLYNWATGKGWLAIPDLARGRLRRDIPAYNRRALRTIERLLHRDADKLVKLKLFIERKIAVPNGVPRREVRQAIDQDEEVRYPAN